MKNIELYKIRNILKKYTNVKNKKFGNILYKNLEIVETILTSINSLNVTPKELIDYEVDRKLLCEKYSTKNENGDITIDNDRYIIEDYESFHNEIDLLNNKYEKYLNIKRDNMNRTVFLLNSECNIIFEKIDFGELPDDMSADDIKNLKFMINE